MSEFSPARMIELRERKGLSQSELGRRAHVGQSTINRLEQGETRNPRNLFDIARALGTTEDYLMQRTDDDGVLEFRGAPSEFDDFSRKVAGAEDRRLAFKGLTAEQDSDVVQVAEIDPQFGLGGAFMDEAAVPEMRSFSRAWLRQITRSAPDELYWARGRGNSMEPTIGDGEIVLIDRSQQTPRDSDLIWAFAWGDVGAIKRLRPMPDGSVKILSDNPAVPQDVAHEGDIHVFGRVVAVVKKL